MMRFARPDDARVGTGKRDCRGRRLLGCVLAQGPEGQVVDRYGEDTVLLHQRPRRSPVLWAESKGISLVQLVTTRRGRRRV
jgi:hypothetical protein